MRPPLIVLLCVTLACSTFSLGAFPALLGDLGRTGLSDAALGTLSGMYGFARMAVDIPVGLLIARHLRRSALVAPVLYALAILCIGSGGPFAVLLAGRALLGVAHALGMICWLTLLLRHSGPRLGASLNAFEFSGMIGMIGGVAIPGLLPSSLGWNVAFLIASAPQLVALALAPLLASSVDRARSAEPVVVTAASRPGTTTARPVSALVVLAFAAGTVISMAYSTIQLFLVPLRASREFGLDRGGVAWVLSVSQVTDAVALLPVGFLADRIGPARVLCGVLTLLATAALAITFGTLSIVTVGAMVLGLGMAGWMLPLGILRHETAPHQLAWRMALYRVGVDGGMFLGPFLGGLLGPHAWTLTTVFSLALFAVAVDLLRRSRGR